MQTLFLVLVFFSLPALSQVTRLIVPDVSAGPIKQSSTLADLRKAFGKNKVKKTKCPLEGDSFEPCIIVTNQKGKEIAVIFDEGVTRNAIVSEESWHSKEGVKIGLSARDLVKINKRPIALWHIYNDAAEIHDWQDGELSKHSAKWQVRLCDSKKIKEKRPNPLKVDDDNGESIVVYTNAMYDQRPMEICEIMVRLHP